LEPAIRDEAAKVIVDRYRKFRDEVIDLRGKEPDAARPAARHKFLALAEDFKSDVSLALKAAHQKQLRHIGLNPPRAPVQASDAQLERWEREVRHALYEHHDLIEKQTRERHAIEIQKSPGQRLEAKHAGELALFRKRKAAEHDALDRRVSHARATRLIPDRDFAPVHSREEIELWADAARGFQQKRHDLEWKADIAAFRLDPQVPFDQERTTKIIERQQAEAEALEQAIGQAFEAGCIPGHEPPAREQAPALER
jgi:hypothetical protein